MNQTTWIVGGGIVIVAISMMLYFFSGDGLPKTDAQSPKVINPETMLTPATSTGDTSEIENSAQQTTTNPAVDAVATPPKGAEVPAEKKAQVLSEVLVKTSMGNITLKLYAKDAPNAVENFTKLAKEGFYNGVRFHRVIKGFMIQTGDPFSKDDTQMESWGQGGPGYKFADEINAQSAIYQRGYKHGVLAMANSGPNTNGSQFFIMNADYPLPPLYVIFGEVVNGLDVVDAIGNVATTGRPNDRPLTPVTITSMEVK